MKPELIKRILSSIMLIPIALFFIIKGSFFFTFFITTCFLITLYEWHMMSKKKTYNIFGFNGSSDVGMLWLFDITKIKKFI